MGRLQTGWDVQPGGGVNMPQQVYHLLEAMHAYA